MFLIVTRNFPPDVGGMQVLMGGLSEGLLNHGPVKVFAFEYPKAENYDKNSSLNIERVRGIKLFRKYRKANLVNYFINENPNIRAIITDHWKSLELLKEGHVNRFKTICLLHSKEINHEKGSSLNKRMLKSTDKAKFIIANSHFTKELAIKNNSMMKGTNDPKDAVKDANVIYTDAFISMGEEDLKDKLADFDGFQVNMDLISGADEDWCFMHCLPAHRGEEVTDEVMDHDNSIVFDQAENRMWAQMSLLVYLIDSGAWYAMGDMMGVGL